MQRLSLRQALICLLRIYSSFRLTKIISQDIARHELKLEDIFDYGLVDCPKTSVGCFYYPHWQCFEKKYGIAYSITGCLNNPSLCDTANKTVKKLNEIPRCCYYSGCNYGLYKYLTALNDSTPVHDFDDCDPCNQCDETSWTNTSTTTSAPSMTAPTVTYSSQESSTVETQSNGEITSTTMGSTDTANTTSTSTLASSSEGDVNLPRPRPGDTEEDEEDEGN